MSVAWQQQVFALDARYNAYRARNHPNFRTLYIRRRNQLLREFGTGKDSALWKQYFKIRSIILQMKYGPSFDQKRHSSRVSPETLASQSVDSDINSTKEIDLPPTEYADASRAMVKNSSIYENYAFVGLHHIFDQHSEAVTMLKFANNERSRLCCISNDATISICNLMSQPPTLERILKGHDKSVTGCDWSMTNDLLVTCSLDGRLCIWDTNTYKCIRSVKDSFPAELFSCLFQPVNNNIVVAGNSNGQVEVMNISTGKKIRSNIGGKVLSLAFESSGLVLWAGNDQGYLMSFNFDISCGKISKHRRMYVGITAAITSINWRAWISREARDPSLLVNIAANLLQLYRVTDKGLELKRSFPIMHNNPKNYIHSIFCPIMSFRKGACIITGSEDSSVYFLDVDSEYKCSGTVNKLQGHSGAVLGVSFNYDESLLSTSDDQGMVIVWKRAENAETQ